jgi:two-component system, chemotaxis family, chemotaxis protein CheY
LVNSVNEEKLVDIGKSILIVEDDQIQRMICVSQLNQLGFEKVSTAEDGNLAYSVLENDKFDVIISDWDMPGLDGLGLLKKVKENPSLKDIPFIILTINSDENIIKKALDLGADDYMVKPSNPNTLKGKLKKIL